MNKTVLSDKYTGTLTALDMFSLRATLISGQCFRWTENEADGDGSITGIMKDMLLTLRQENNYIYVSGCPEERLPELYEYLDLGTDYDEIRTECVAAEPRLRKAAERCAGIHILRQEPWEALCSFIISQNNNIPRIRLIIRRLCALCGDRIPGCGGDDAFTFPSAATVAALSGEQLDRIGCGYRSGYILSAAESAATGRIDFDALRTMDIEQCREELLKLYGVGPKVADCFMLYGLHRLECFPRDVWIKRALAEEFSGTPLQSSRYAGVAQQYIFEHIRGQAKNSL